MNKFLQYVATVAILCLCSSTVMADDSSLISCENATSLTSLNSSFLGVWYEETRSPAIEESCVGLNISSNTTGFFLSITTSSNSSVLYSNSTVTYALLNSTIVPSTTNTTDESSFTSPPGGFYYILEDNDYENITVKVLLTDYTNYALICGYSNTTNTSYGAVLTREQVVTTATLATYAALVNESYSDFSNLTAITQTSACYEESSAASHASVLSLIFAIVYATLKLIS